MVLGTRQLLPDKGMVSYNPTTILGEGVTIPILQERQLKLSEEMWSLPSELLEEPGFTEPMTPDSPMTPLFWHSPQTGKVTLYTT